MGVWLVQADGEDDLGAGRGRGDPDDPFPEIVDDFWAEIVHWATVEQPKLAAEQQRKIFEERIAAHPEAERVHAIARPVERAD